MFRQGTKRGIGTAAIVLVLALGAGPARAAGRRHADPAGGCSRLPAGKPLVKLNLKPETEIADLVAWISSITCKQFVLSGDAAAIHAKVTIIAPALITPGDAYRLFLDALDSVGLAVFPSGKFLRIVESAKAKSSPIPVTGLGS